MISDREEMGGGAMMGQRENCLKSDTVHHGGEGMETGARGSWSRCVYSQDTMNVDAHASLRCGTWV